MKNVTACGRSNSTKEIHLTYPTAFHLSVIFSCSPTNDRLDVLRSAAPSGARADSCGVRSARSTSRPQGGSSVHMTTPAPRPTNSVVIILLCLAMTLPGNSWRTQPLNHSQPDGRWRVQADNGRSPAPTPSLSTTPRQKMPPVPGLCRRMRGLREEKDLN